MRFVTKHVVVRQLRHLRGGGLHQARLVEPHCNRPEASHTLDVLFASRVVDVDALATIDHDRSDALVQPGVRIRMQLVGDVGAGQ